MSEDERVSRIIHTIEQMFSQVEDRITRLENEIGRRQNRPNIILDENRVIERPGALGGRTYSTDPNGGIFREIRVPTCGTCGVLIEDHFTGVI